MGRNRVPKVNTRRIISRHPTMESAWDEAEKRTARKAFYEKWDAIEICYYPQTIGSHGKKHPWTLEYVKYHPRQVSDETKPDAVE